MSKRQSKLDKQIEAIYYKVASGVQINIMNISKLFRLATDLHTQDGLDLETAVKAAVAKYREN